MALIAIVLVVIFFFFRRKIVQDKKEKLKELKEDFKGEVPLKKETDEDKKVLDEISEKIENAGEEGKESVEITLDEGFDINLEAPDVFSLETPRTCLYKSFKNGKFEDIEQSEKGVKLYFR